MRRNLGQYQLEWIPLISIDTMNGSGHGIEFHLSFLCKGRTIMATFHDGLELCKERNLAEKLAT